MVLRAVIHACLDVDSSYPWAEPKSTPNWQIHRFLTASAPVWRQPKRQSENLFYLQGLAQRPSLQGTILGGSAGS